MKGVMKLFWVAAAFAAVLGFAACDNPSGSTNDNSGDSGGLISNSGGSGTNSGGSGGASGKTLVAEYESSNVYGMSGQINLKFFNDKTYTSNFFYVSGEKRLLASKSEGTYTGDPTKNGVVATTATKGSAINDDGALMNKPDKWDGMTLQEKDISKFTDSEKNGTLTISDNGQKAIDGNMTFTRK